MSAKKGVGWYQLPKEYRNMLRCKSRLFEDLRDSGTWIYPPKEYDVMPFAILRCDHTIFVETMRVFAEIMKDDKIDIGIFLVGMKIADVLFYEKGTEGKNEIVC